jgi:hypothetical protein
VTAATIESAPASGRLDRLVPVVITVLVLLVAIMTITPWPVGAFEDDGIYTVLARSLATGEGFRLTNLPGSPNATHYPPGYPFVLSLLWRASPGFPDNIVIFKFANAVFLALAALGTWYFARTRLAMSSTAAGVVAVVSTISIVVLLVTGLVLSEPLFLALLMPALFFAERTADTGDLRTAVLAGALLGALALVRTLGALAVPAAVLVLLLRRQLHAAVVVGAVAALFIVPWQVWTGLHGQEVAPVLMGKFGAYGPWLSDGYTDGGWPFVRAVIGRNLQGLEGMLGYMVMPVRAEWPRTLALLTVVLLGFAGALSLVRRMPVSIVFLGLYLVTVLLWPFDANRFLWAIWPLLVMAVWRCASRMWLWRDGWPMPRVVHAALLVLALVPAAGFLVYNARGYRQKWWASIQVTAGEQARPLVEWVAQNTAMTDVIATERDLVVHLYTGRRATPVSTFLPIQRLRPLTDAEDLEAMRDILAAYQPRYVIVTARQSVASAEALASATPPALRRLGKLPNALIYERVTP